MEFLKLLKFLKIPFPAPGRKLPFLKYRFRHLGRPYRLLRINPRHWVLTTRFPQRWYRLGITNPFPALGRTLPLRSRGLNPRHRVLTARFPQRRFRLGIKNPYPALGRQYRPSGQKRFPALGRQYRPSGQRGFRHWVGSTGRRDKEGSGQSFESRAGGIFAGRVPNAND